MVIKYKKVVKKKNRLLTGCISRVKISDCIDQVMDGTFLNKKKKLVEWYGGLFIYAIAGSLLELDVL